MTQLLNANVALNGLSNVWVVPCARSDQSWVSLQAKQPQFNFFSSPVGVRAHTAQTEGMQEHEQVQLYDWDTMVLFQFYDNFFEKRNIFISIQIFI